MSSHLSLSKDDIKIVLLEGVHSSALETLRYNGFSNIDYLTGALTGDALAERIKDAHLIGVRSRTQVTQQVLEQAQNLMAVGCFCIGTNQVDLKEAASKGIPVFNAPHSNTRSVAELVIGQTIMLMRGIFPRSMAAHRREWRKSAKGSHEVRGKTIGIVGYGHIGSQVSILAESMGLRVIYYDIQSKLPLGNAKKVESLMSLLERSDVVTLHVPQDETTRNMMDREHLGAMKKGAHLINASRGTVVDLDALVDYLKSGHIGGAAIDVYPKEPSSNDAPLESPLVGRENVILTPHIGGSTMEAQENIGREVANRFVTYCDAGSTEGSVNFPIVNMPVNKDAHRLLHIHRNKPGILSHINDIMGRHDINVLGQFLATKNDLGYVVLDIEDNTEPDLIAGLEKIEGTIRTRVLY